MERKMFSGLLVIFFVIGISYIAIAGMSSDNYTITTSVLSGGGAPMGSGSYQTNSTLGQSSPLIDPAEPPGSVNYDLYPGFWYTLEAGMTGCENLSSFAAAYGAVSADLNYNSQCDFDVDGDIDGSDLSDFIAGYGL